MGRNFYESGFYWIAILLLLSTTAIAGPLDPPAPPAPTFKTLDEVAPGTPIRQTDLPLTISEPGHYYLVENLEWTGTGAAISIMSTGTTLDLGGFVISGLNPSFDSNRVGVSSSAIGNVIRNGRINNMGGGGISASFATIENVAVTNCHRVGIRNIAGITRHCEVRNITRIADSPEQVTGIDCGADSIVEDCVVISVRGLAGIGAIVGVSGADGSAIRRVKIYDVASPSPNDNPTGVYGIRTVGAGFVEQCHVESIQGNLYAVETIGIRSGRLTRIQGNHVQNVAARFTCMGIHASSQASVTDNYIGTIGSANSNGNIIGVDLGDRASATGNTIEMWRPTSDFNVTVTGIRTNSLASVDQNVIRLDMTPATAVNAAGVRVVSGATRVADNRIHVQVQNGDPSSIGRGIFMMPGTAGGYAGGNISRGAIVDSGTNAIGAGNFANQIY